MAARFFVGGDSHLSTTVTQFAYIRVVKQAKKVVDCMLFAWQEFHLSTTVTHFVHSRHS